MGRALARASFSLWSVHWTLHSERYRAPYQPLEALNARLQPERLLAQDGAVKALDLTYGYDLNGRITSQTNGVDSNHSRTYSYDRAGRLKSAISPAWGSANYSYDALGNIRSKTFSNWNGSSRTVTNDYDTKNRILSTIDTANITYGFNYDNRGNIRTTGLMNFTYDRADQPITVSGPAPNTGVNINASYTYDGNLKRVKSVVNGKTIYNVYDFAGRLAHVDEITDNKETDYLHGMGQTVARIQNNNFTYLHPDHLGSAQSGTDRYGNVLWTEHYTPFGEALVNNAANYNQGGFTSHIKDKATGLNYMQARYYDPGIGRFLSVDPVGFIGSGGNPQYFNRYAYVGNDPINLLDPTGMYHCSDSDCDQVDQYYNRLVELRDSTNEGSQNRAELDRSLDAIGAKGKEGSPNIKIDESLTSPGKYDGSTNTISLNPDPDIRHYDPVTDSPMLDIITSDLAHEGSHVATYNESGSMKTLADRLTNELTAYDATIAADDAMNRRGRRWPNRYEGALSSINTSCGNSTSSTCSIP